MIINAKEFYKLSVSWVEEEQDIETRFKWDRVFDKVIAYGTYSEMEKKKRTSGVYGKDQNFHISLISKDDIKHILDILPEECYLKINNGRVVHFRRNSTLKSEWEKIKFEKTYVKKCKERIPIWSSITAGLYPAHFETDWWKKNVSQLKNELKICIESYIEKDPKPYLYKTCSFYHPERMRNNTYYIELNFRIDGISDEETFDLVSKKIARRSIGLYPKQIHDAVVLAISNIIYNENDDQIKTQFYELVATNIIKSSYQTISISKEELISHLQYNIILSDGYIKRTFVKKEELFAKISQILNKYSIYAKYKEEIFNEIKREINSLDTCESHKCNDYKAIRIVDNLSIDEKAILLYAETDDPSVFMEWDEEIKAKDDIITKIYKEKYPKFKNYILHPYENYMIKLI